MTQSLTLRSKGIITNPNNLGSLPDGALSEADNIYIDRDDTAEPRRGFAVYAEEFGTTSSRASQLLTYQERLLRHYGSVLSYDSATGQGPFTDYASSVQSVESDVKLRGVELNGNLYITTSTGILKLDQVNTELQKAGGVKALDLEGDLSGATGGGFFDNNNQVAYRVLWGFKDRNNNLILGTPSERTVISNTSGNSDNVDLTFTVPDGVTVDHFYQVYRTALSGASGVDPGDDQQLVFEDNPTSSEITAKVITITDVTPDSFRGDALYTNDNQQGILQANEIPPFAKDIAVYKNSIFYANTKTKYRLNIALLSSLSFTNASTLTITDGTNPFTLTFNDTTENASIGQVLYTTSGTPAQNVDDTARSIARVINRYLSNTIIYAFYVSGVDDVPGQMLLESKSLGGAAYYITASDTSTGNSFNPTIPTSGTTVIADNEIIPNRIYYSKFQQPEAVPIINQFDVGARNSVILRVVALRDSLFVFKQDGIYRVIGDAVNGFQVSLFDNSAIILAPESPAVGNNQIFLLADQGVIRVSDVGVDIVSSNIENQLRPLSSSSFVNLKSATFGFYYTTGRRYYLWTVDEFDDDAAVKAYVYNVFTSTWTNIPSSKTCGIVGPDDKIYLGAGDLNSIEQERKDFSYTDYADRDYDTIISSFDGSSITVNSIINMNIGDILTQVVYLTPVKFNALLAKIDEDPGVPSNDYYSTLKITLKSEMRDNLDALANKLDADGLSHTNYFSSMSGSTLPSGIQSDFNIVVGLLNTDTVAMDGDYQTSSSTNRLETNILSIDTTNSIIEVELEFDWDLATVTYFNRIVTNIVWSPQHAGDPSIWKQFRETNLMFSDITSNVVDLSFRSSEQRDYEKIPFESDSTGAWGEFPWGEEPWGGYSGPRAFRSYIPGQKQRCRFLEPKFEHKRAFESYLLVGLSLTFDKMEERVGR